MMIGNHLEQLKTDIVCVVWGQQYTRMMLEYCLASLLAEGNLPAWPYGETTILHIYTTPEDAPQIQHHPHFQALTAYIQVQLHLELNPHDTPIYALMNHGHRMAIEKAIQRQAALMYIAPDHVFATGCFKDLLFYLEQDVSLIMALTPRVNTTCREKLNQLRQANSLAVSPELAGDIFMDYLHPTVKAFFGDTDTFKSWCSQVYYVANKKTVVAQAFHLHPLFIVSPHPYIVTDTLDGDYLQFYDGQRDKIRIATDNRLFVLSLTDPDISTLGDDVFEGQLSMEQRQLMLDRFRRSSAFPIHRWFFDHPITLTGGGALAFSRTAASECGERAIRALQVFWQVEEDWLAGTQGKVREHYQQGAPLLEDELPMVLRQAYQIYGTPSTES